MAALAVPARLLRGANVISTMRGLYTPPQKTAMVRIQSDFGRDFITRVNKDDGMVKLRGLAMDCEYCRRLIQAGTGPRPTSVSCIPRRERHVLLLSSKHWEPAVCEDGKQKPQIIIDYNRCKAGVDNLDKNGDSQSARFRFPAFRFVEQENETVSTYYLHCITRLCEKSTCSTFKQCNNRRKRSALDTSEDGITKTYTISSPEIITNSEGSKSKDKPYDAQEGDNNSSAGLGVAVGVLAFVCLIALCVAAVFYKRLRN
ncbi:hypothetical protein GBF38_018178 [Nibea albiflora]|uniref:Uncharacterized protein n=1 Tax=Nibea albiflora TaxID=240163 RepID=A0ACB7EFR1_NIBAL|nr:hypothetical protein GBF38_018178 [Nibea albiflora]